MGPRLASRWRQRPGLGSFGTSIEPTLQTTDQIVHLGGWFQAEFVVEKPPVDTNMTQRVRPVPLCEIRSDEDAVSTLSERLRRDGRQTRVDSGPIHPDGCQMLAQCFESMQSQLMEPFALDHQPIFVPPRKELARSRDQSEISGRMHRRPILNPIGRGDELLDVRDDVRSESKTGAR
jgi:hypothetical protein